MSLATDGGIIEQAFKKVESLSPREDSKSEEDEAIRMSASEEEPEPEEDIEKE